MLDASAVGADPRLADVRVHLAAAKRRVEVLPRQLDGELDEFDHVLIDCPPNHGLLAVNAVVLASELVVPVRMTKQPEFDRRPRRPALVPGGDGRRGRGAADHRSGVDSDERQCGIVG